MVLHCCTVTSTLETLGAMLMFAESNEANPARSRLKLALPSVPMVVVPWRNGFLKLFISSVVAKAPSSIRDTFSLAGSYTAVSTSVAGVDTEVIRGKDASYVPLTTSSVSDKPLCLP